MLPWSIIAFARTTLARCEPTGANAWGEPVDFDLVIESALRLMEEASLPVAQAMREDREESTKGAGARVHVRWRAHALRAADGGADGPRGT